MLNISCDPYMADRGIRFEDLPIRTRKWMIAGDVEVYFCKNTGPYRKLLPVIERLGCGNFLVATADDDVLYPPEWLEGLANVAIPHNCVAAYRCRVMQWKGGELAPYNHWPVLACAADLKARGMEDSTPYRQLFATGRDGVMYHASYLRDIDALRQLRLLAPGQDDIAFKFTTLMAGVSVAKVARREGSTAAPCEFPAAVSGGSSLWANNSTGRNDEVLAEVIEWCRRHRSFVFTQQS
jgi:hypothetical protein